MAMARTNRIVEYIAAGIASAGVAFVVYNAVTTAPRGAPSTSPPAATSYCAGQRHELGIALLAAMDNPGNAELGARVDRLSRDIAKAGCP